MIWDLLEQGAYEVAWDLCEGEGLFLPLEEAPKRQQASPAHARHTYAHGGLRHEFPMHWGRQHTSSHGAIWSISNSGGRTFTKQALW